MLILCLLLTASSSAMLSEYQSEYDIIGASALVKISLDFSQPVQGFEWKLPLDAELTGAPSVPYEILDYKDYKVMLIDDARGEIDFSYATSDVIEQSKESFFILDLSGVGSAKKSVLVKLPEGASLKYSLSSPTPSIVPKTEDVVTDGRRIIVHWDEEDMTRSEAVMIIYEQQRNYAWAMFLAFLLLLAVSGVSFFIMISRKYFPEDWKKPEAAGAHPAGQRQSQRHDFTRNLFEEEKLVVETLLKEKTRELWQKQLEQKTGLSKVKLSRKLRSLEAKGLIEKIPYGNTNKIRLKDGQAS